MRSRGIRRASAAVKDARDGVGQEEKGQQDAGDRGERLEGALQ